MPTVSVAPARSGQPQAGLIPGSVARFRTLQGP